MRTFLCTVRLSESRVYMSVVRIKIEVGKGRKFLVHLFLSDSFGKLFQSLPSSLLYLEHPLQLLLFSDAGLGK